MERKIPCAANLETAYHSYLYWELLTGYGV